MADEPYNPSPIGNPSVLARRSWWQTRLVIFIGKHTPKCREMVGILSQSMDRPLPLSMRIKKRVHFLICCWCQRYEEQLHYLRKTSRQFPLHAGELADVPVTNEMKQRWKEVLRPSTQLVQDWSEKRETLTRSSRSPAMHWTRGIMLVAAAAVIMLAFVFVWMKTTRPAASLVEYRDEMLSFAKVDPALEMQSPQLTTLTNWLQTTHGMSGIAVPEKLHSMEPVGCRVLRFRGHDVGLICFRQANGKLLHLFVIDRSVFPDLPGYAHRDMAMTREWGTAAWTEGDHAYLVAIQGDKSSVESFL